MRVSITKVRIFHERHQPDSSSKTRLLTEALRSSEGRDRRVVKGSCLALGRDIP